MHIRRVLPPDAIPSIDDPTFGPTYRGDDDDQVVVLVEETVAGGRDAGGGEGDAGEAGRDAVETAGGDAEPEREVARAYPVRILDYHEVVNDVVGGVPVAVTWCPLCGCGVVYDRRVGGRTLTFGVSGTLADDDLVLYDRETGSEWKQSLGRCIAGEYENQSLAALPAPMMAWREFHRAYPEGPVLQPAGTKSEAASDTDEPAAVDYTVAPYESYVEGEGFGLDAHRGTGSRTWDRDDLDPKTVVLGVTGTGDDGDSTALGFPLPRVRDAGGVVTARIGTTDVVVFTAGDGIHAFEDPGHAFTVDDGEIVADGTAWDPVTGASADGRRLDRVPARRLFAFAWQDDHGPEAFWGAR